MLERFLDTTGLLCPLPVLKARRALREMSPGEEVEVHATDPGAERDFADLCAATGDRLVEFRQDGGTLVFRIRKRS